MLSSTMTMKHLCVILLQVKCISTLNMLYVVMHLIHICSHFYTVCSDLPQENAYEEDEGETCTFLAPKAYDGGFVSNMVHKKKHVMPQRISIARPYEIGTYVPYEPCMESKSRNQPLLSNGKRPTSFLAIPPKRTRTAARQRVVSPFHAGASGPPQVTSKTDVSSGDTNSYQEDQSSLHGGSLAWRNTDFESTVDSDRQLPYDAGEMCTKAIKKKKMKNSGYKIAQNAANSYVPTSIKVNSSSFIGAPLLLTYCWYFQCFLETNLFS